MITDRYLMHAKGVKVIFTFTPFAIYYATGIVTGSFLPVA